MAPREGNTFVEAVTPIFYAIVEDLTERELAVLRYLPSLSSPIDVPRLRQRRRTQTPEALRLKAQLNSV